MKVFLSILFGALSFTVFGQLNLDLSAPYKINWSLIEISNDSLAKELSLTNTILKSRYTNFPQFLHLVNIDNDLKPDAIFYWPDNSNEPIFEIYLNKGGNLQLVLEKRGTITDSNINRFFGSIRFTLHEVGYTSPPFLNRIHTIEISTNRNKIEDDTILYFGELETPAKLDLHHRFEVTQPKYRLRNSPEINDHNIICELSNGDQGMALASKTDETGRVWWFVLVDNNIQKSTDDYFYIDSSSPEGLNKKMLGWISSRFAKKVE